MHGPTCIFWSNLTPCSLQGWCVFGPEMELEATGVRPTTRFKDVHNWLDELRQQ